MIFVSCSIADPDDTALGRLSATRNTGVHDERPYTGSLGDSWVKQRG
jgi:hypothetical protein